MGIWKQDGINFLRNPNNSISKKLSDEFKTTINTPKKAYLYMPVHNINDIYEWYRIFNDSYYYQKDPDIDKDYIDNIGQGIGITMYSNKDRAKTIEAWFPNLVEVKSTSSDECEYRYDGNSIKYFKHSIDFIDNYNEDINGFHVGEYFHFGGTDIKIGEKVLLKNQELEELEIYDLEDNNIINHYNINNINKTITLNIDNNLSPKKLFNKNGKLICISNDKVLTEHNITSVYITENTNDTDIQILLDTTHDLRDCKYIADKINGKYTIIDYKNKDNEDTLYSQQNGVYEYDGEYLTLIDDMYIDFKTYNQCVYTYQGINQNNVYYLRRHEEKFTKHYSRFPTSNKDSLLDKNDEDALPIIYSHGNPYLIECEVNYDVAMKPTDFSNISAECSYYNENFDFLEHPEHEPPYELEDNIFRLLYTDYDVARKMQWKSNIGVVDFKFDENGDDIMINNGNIFHIIKFKDSNNKNNYHYLYNHDNGFPNNSITISYEFDAYKSENADVNSKIIINDNNNNNVTRFSESTNTIVPVDGGILSMKIKGYINDELILDINEVIKIDEIESDGNDILIKTNYVLFDDENIKNIIQKINDKGRFEYELERLDRYGYGLDTNTQQEEIVKDFINTINKTIYGEVFDFGYEEVFDIYDNIVGYKLVFNKIRNNNNIYVYCDMTQDIENSASQSNTIMPNFRNVYDPNYTYTKYLKDYLDYDTDDVLDTRVPSLDITGFKEDGTTTYTAGHIEPEHQLYGKNIKITNAEYFKIFKNAELGNKKEGTIIEYGSDYYDYFLKNIKHHTFCKITTNGDTRDIFILSNQYDFDNNIGQIVLHKGIEFGHNTNVTISFNPIYDIETLSEMYEEVFDTTYNTPFDVQNDSGVHNVMKPSTYGYANDFINLRHKYTHLTGIVYKEFNEMVYTFFKRDKKFTFKEDPIIDFYNVLTYNGLNIEDYDLGDIIYTQEQEQFYIVSYDENEDENIFELISANENAYYNNINEPSTDNKYCKFYTVGDKSVLLTDEFIRRIKKDYRLNITFRQMAKLGVDNEYQPFLPINYNNDVIEIEENLVSVDALSNLSNNIRFIDGLTYNKIINNIDNQGQYAWILHPNVITENAVVGKNTNGDLIWYTGKWIDGVWCDGIWIQGEWFNGIWVNGKMYAYDIQDNISSIYVDYSSPIESLTTWENGEHINGELHNGNIQYIKWYNGEMYGGTIQDGHWLNGILYGGIIEHITWESGKMYGGEFQTGIWYDGDMYNGIFGNGAYTASNDFKTRAIWRNGRAHKKTGQYNPIFTTKYKHENNISGDNNATVIYNGLFESILKSGVIVASNISNADIEHGIVIGGYYCELINNNEIRINPKQWEELLFGNDYENNVDNYLPNDKHNYTKYNNEIYIMAEASDNTNNNYYINQGFKNNYDNIYKYKLDHTNELPSVAIISNPPTQYFNYTNTNHNDYESNITPYVTYNIKRLSSSGGTFIKIYSNPEDFGDVAFNDSIIVDGYLNKVKIN